MGDRHYQQERGEMAIGQASNTTDSAGPHGLGLIPDKANSPVTFQGTSINLENT